MPVVKRQVPADMSVAASVALAAAWSGAVGGLLAVMILVRVFG